MTDLWLVDNQVDVSSILQTSGETVPVLGAHRLRESRLGMRWRASGGASIIITFPAPVVVDVVGIFGVVSTGIFGVTTDLTGPMPAQIDPWAAQSVWVAPDYLRACQGGQSEPLRAPTTSLTVTVTGDACDIGRIWVGGAVWVPEISHNYGAEQGVEDLSTVLRTRRSGAVIADTGNRIRTQTVTYDSVSPDEWNGPTREIALRAGLSKQLLFIPNPQVYDPQKHAMLAYQDTINPIVAAGFRRFQRVFALKEAR